MSTSKRNVRRNISAIEDSTSSTDLYQMLDVCDVVEPPKGNASSIKTSPRFKPILKRGSFGEDSLSSQLSTQAQQINLTEPCSPKVTPIVRVSSILSLSQSSKKMMRRNSSQLSLSQSSHKPMRKNSSVVSFQNVEIREYDRILGDNPACMSGPPISLDWSHSEGLIIPMEQYEKVKENKKKKNLPRLGKLKRIGLLQNQLGYSEDEINAATKKTKEIRRSRSFTNMTSSLWRIEDVAQSAQRKLKRAIKRTNSSNDITKVTTIKRNYSSNDIAKVTAMKRNDSSSDVTKLASFEEDESFCIEPSLEI